MIARRGERLVQFWIYPAVLLAINVLVSWRLFRTEYLSYMGSIEGSFIALARMIAQHGVEAWWPYWYSGMPFANTYPPGLHVTVALVSRMANMSAARAYHVVIAAAYSLGPVTFYFLARRLSQQPGWSMCAALLYSLTSPSAWLAKEILQDLGKPWQAQRLHSAVVYGDGPNVAALTLLPLAILLLDRALERRTAAAYVLAAMGLASVPLVNWPAAIALTFAVAAYAFTRDGVRWRSTLGRVALLGALAYGFCMPLLPPSTILLTQANTQRMSSQNGFGSRHLLYFGLAACGASALLWCLARWQAPRHFRFFALFFFLCGFVTLAHYWAHVAVLAQPNRFHLAMEMGFCGAAVFAVSLILRQPAARRIALVLFLCLLVSQTLQYRWYARWLVTRAVIQDTSQFRIGSWFAGHPQYGRVMAEASLSYWLNAFADTAQMSGCCDQSILGSSGAVSKYIVESDDGAGARAVPISLAWLRVLGAQAVAVAGPNGTEPYLVAHPRKFDGALPLLWGSASEEIFEVPQRSRSLAHVVRKAELPARAPVNGIDIDPLLPYVQAIEDPARPSASLQWQGSSAMRVTATVGPGEAVSIQVMEHPGWRASAGGRPVPIHRDAIGHMWIELAQTGPVQVDFRFTGGTERLLCWIISFACWTGAAIAIGQRHVLRMLK